MYREIYKRVFLLCKLCLFLFFFLITKSGIKNNVIIYTDLYKKNDFIYMYVRITTATTATVN